MDPLNILIWFGVILAGIILLAVIIVVALAVWADVVGVRRMRDVEEGREIIRGGSK